MYEIFLLVSERSLNIMSVGYLLPRSSASLASCSLKRVYESLSCLYAHRILYTKLFSIPQKKVMTVYVMLFLSKELIAWIMETVVECPPLSKSHTILMVSSQSE